MKDTPKALPNEQALRDLERLFHKMRLPIQIETGMERVDDEEAFLLMLKRLAYTLLTSMVHVNDLRQNFSGLGNDRAAMKTRKQYPWIIKPRKQ